MSIRLLLVDDHEMVREVLKLALAETGVEVVAEAATVKAARQLAGHAQVDAVLLDVRLRDGDGFEVLSWFKTIRAQLPVLMYSLSNSAADLKRSETLGASGFVTKDSDVKTLVEAIQQVTAGKNLWQDNPIGSPSVISGSQTCTSNG